MEHEFCKTTGKKMFPTLGDAKSVLKKPIISPTYDGKRVKRRMNKRKEIRAYLCDDCLCYHLTSKNHFVKTKGK